MCVATTGTLTNFSGDGIDVAIRYGGGDYPGLTSEFLAAEDVSPVCSPRLMAGEHPLKTPEDLEYPTLIRDAYPIDWAVWLESAGVTDVDPKGGLTFDFYTFAIEAAVQGEGVALGRTMLVEGDLAAGRLVRPFEHALQAQSSFYLVYPPEVIRQRKVKAFRDWLFFEIGDASLAAGGARRS